MRRFFILLFAFFYLSQGVFCQTYLLDIGVEQFIPVPDVSIGYVDKAIWACESQNITFIKKDEAGAIIKINSYFDDAVTIELLYVVKYLTNKGQTRQYTGIRYFNIQCKGSAPSIVPSGLNLKIGEEYQLTVSNVPSQSNIEWQSYSPPIASVSNTGLVKAKKKGTSIIFATVPGLSQVLSCLVYVKDTKLSLDASPSSLEVELGTEINLYSSKPTAIIYYTLDGSSPEENGEIYTKPIIIEDDIKLKAIAYDPDGEKEPSDILSKNYKVKKVNISATSDDTSLVNGTEITISANPVNSKVFFTIDGSEPSESSILYSNPLIANKDFTLKAIGYCDGYKASDLLVRKYKVAPNPINFTISPNILYLAVGGKAQLTSIFYPDNAMVRYINYKVDDNSIASVDNTGIVTALKSGETTIIASTSNGLTSSCSLYVPNPKWMFNLWISDGTKHSFVFDENPEVLMESSMMIINTSKTQIKIKSRDVVKITITDESLSDYSDNLEQKVEGNQLVKVSYNQMCIQNSEPNLPINVYDIKGFAVLNTQTDENGNLLLSFDKLNQGIYIIKIGNLTHKIIRR